MYFSNYRNSFYGFSSARNSIEICREKDRESLIYGNTSMSNIQLYKLDQQPKNSVKSRSRCSQHGVVKYYTEQGTQTFRSVRRKSGRKKSFISGTTSGLKLGRSRSKFSLGLSKRSLSGHQASPSVSPSRNSLAEEEGGEAEKKSETSFTKRNIKSQVSVISIIFWLNLSI